MLFLFFLFFSLSSLSVHMYGSSHATDFALGFACPAISFMFPSFSVSREILAMKRLEQRISINALQLLMYLGFLGRSLFLLGVTCLCMANFNTLLGSYDIIIQSPTGDVIFTISAIIVGYIVMSKNLRYEEPYSEFVIFAVEGIPFLLVCAVHIVGCLHYPDNFIITEEFLSFGTVICLYLILILIICRRRIFMTIGVWDALFTSLITLRAGYEIGVTLLPYLALSYLLLLALFPIVHARMRDRVGKNWVLASFFLVRWVAMYPLTFRSASTSTPFCDWPPCLRAHAHTAVCLVHLTCICTRHYCNKTLRLSCVPCLCPNHSDLFVFVYFLPHCCICSATLSTSACQRLSCC